jgi:uncharacterized protein (DUF1501 family)
MAQNTPLVLRGGNSVTSWAPSALPDAEDSTIERLQDLYAGDEFFAKRLVQALDAQAIAEADAGMASMNARGNEAQQMQTLASATARFLTARDGPRIAVLEAGGWDTHANQGTTSGALANRFEGLDAGVRTLRQELGDTWSETVVAIVTEFGRTVAVNGTRGTDHGTASAAIVLGGAVAGGRVLADWPGLRQSDLYQGRDLQPTTDLRSVFKGILADHLELPESWIETRVFPDSSAATPMRGLINSA